MTSRLLAALLAVAMATSASAQVTYRSGGGGATRSAHPSADGADAYGTNQSYQILGTPDGPAVRVVERCAYPDGWNVTDFSRDLNGIPAGYDHMCPVATSGRQGVLARY